MVKKFRVFLSYVVFMQVKDTELSKCQHQIQDLQAAHQQELAEVDKRWHQCLEQQLVEAEARYKEELTELSKEWHWERKVQFCLVVCALQVLQLPMLSTVQYKTVYLCT
jgi:hypothetical protein